jgi:hypothetical protein
MPSITTHFIQSEEIYKKMSKEEKKHIKNNKTIYNIFAQSHDFLFYSLFNKKIKSLGHYAHHHETQNYLLNIIKEIKTKKLENNPEIMAYLYGVITHYSMDTVCHPYIFYKTGVYRKHEKWTHKYRGEHNHIEKELDAFYYEKYFHKKYNRCNINKEIIKNPKFSNELIELISKVYKKTYNEDNIGNIYYKCIGMCKMINTLVVHDLIGIKKCIYMLIDLIARRRIGFITSYSNHIMKPKSSWLNEEHKEWNHPCYKDKKFTYSFDDLFKQSITKSLNIIKEVNKLLYEDGNLNSLKKLIPNDDYATGITCDDPHTLEYFEY